MKDLHRGILLEFAERQRLAFDFQIKYPFDRGLRGSSIPASPGGRQTRVARRACPDCGAPLRGRYRCVACAANHAADDRARRKAA